MHLQNIIWNEILHLFGKPIPRTATASSFFNPLIFQEGRGQQSLFAGSVFEQMPTIWEHVNRNLRGSNEKSRPNLIIETLCLLYKGNNASRVEQMEQRSPSLKLRAQDKHTQHRVSQTTPPLFYEAKKPSCNRKVNNTTFTLLTSLGPQKEGRLIFNRHYSIPEIHHLCDSLYLHRATQGLNFML